MPEPVILDTHSLIFRLNEGNIDPETIKTNLQHVATERPDDFPKVADALAQHLKGIQSRFQEAKGAHKHEQSRRKTITKIGVVTLLVVMLTGMSIVGVFASRASRYAEQERIAREQAMELELEAKEQAELARANAEEAEKQIDPAIQIQLAQQRLNELVRFTHTLGDVVNALAKCDEFELYSLNPNIRDEKSKDNEKFQKWPILGKLTIKDEATRKKLVEAFQKSAEVETKERYLCFIPRHGIRFVKEGKNVEMVICFECDFVRIFVEKEDPKGYPINNSARDIFNKVLTDAKIPIPEPEKDDKQ